MASTIEVKARILAKSVKEHGIYSEKEIVDIMKTVEETDNDPDGKKAQYRKTAKLIHEEEGSLEFDEDAIVSISEDGGAYVQCWKYIELE